MMNNVRVIVIIAPMAKLVVGIVMGVILGGCQVSKQDDSLNVTLTPTHPIGKNPVSLEREERDSIDRLVSNWLAGKPCSPPCWEGIVPGQTTIAEAQRILDQHPFVADLEVVEAVAPHLSDVGEIYWNWKGTEQGGGVLSYYINSTVYRISVSYPSKPTLQDVIDAYGEPSHVHAWALPSSDGSYTVFGLDVVYMPQGFALEWSGTPDNVHKPEFGPEWTSFSVNFFDPGEEGFALAHNNPNYVVNLVPWQGLLNFDSYCMGSRCD